MRVYRKRRGSKPQRKFLGKRRYGRRGGKVFKRKVKRVIEETTEKKYIDGGGNTSVTNAGTFIYFNDGIAPGAANGARVGDNIKIRSIQATLQFNSSVGSANGLNWRIIVGRWNAYWISTPSTSSIFNDPSDAINSQYNRINLEQRRWTPLYDSRFTGYSNAATGKITTLKKMKFFGKRLPRPRLTYNTGNTPDAVYFVLFINDFAGVSPFPALSWRWRMTYTDY